MLIGFAFLAFTLVQAIPDDDPRIPYKFSCRDLGDIPETYLAHYYCYSCVATYPGCRRCEEHEEKLYDPFSEAYRVQYRCAQCDQGMFLYPIEKVVQTQDPITGVIRAKTYNYETCVPDCAQYDMNMVNNPVKMRCEYLGIGCLYGNYTHGCLKSIQAELVTELITLDIELSNSTLPHQKWLKTISTPSQYSVSVQLFPDIKPQENVLKTLDDCIISKQDNSSQQVCLACGQGYIIKDGTCLRRCPSGSYPQFQLATDPSLLINNTQGIYLLKCERTEEDTCYDRLFEGENGCKTCKRGFKLWIKNNIMQTGECLKDNYEDNQGLTSELTVIGGNRASQLTQNDSEFIDLLSALKHAYSLHIDQNVSHIVIYLDPNVDHYVTPTYFEEAYPLIEDNYLLDQNYSLTILPIGCQIGSKCSVKATVYNRIGGRFRIYMPIQGNFMIKNVIFDSVDSILDSTESEIVKSCLNSGSIQCCSIDTSLQYLSCNDNFGNTLLPKFNIQSACYSKPVTGALFNVQIYDPQYLFQEDYQTKITIKDCEFRNFFYEMNSLVQLPVFDIQYDKANYNLTISGSTFTRFSTCGSLLSNYHIFDTVQFPNYTKERFAHPMYKGYSIQWEKAANQYMRDRYTLQKPTTFTKTKWFKNGTLKPPVISAFERFNTQKFESQVTLRNNSFSHFNYLKATHLEGDITRLSLSMDEVGNIMLRNQGLIVSFFDNFNQSYISIENNNFYNIFQAYQVFYNTSYSSYQSLQSIYGSYYAQINHLISLTNITRSLMIINGNKFRNISLSGPLINLAETMSQFTVPFIIADNSFDLISSLINSNVIHISRRKLQTSNGYEYLDQIPNVDVYPNYIYSMMWEYKLGGSIVIIRNNFTEICGQEQVDASVMLIGVIHEGKDRYANYRGHYPILSTQYFQSIFWEKLFLQEESIFMDVRIVHSQIGEISLIRMGVNISQNRYQDICMGPQVYDVTQMDRFSRYPKARGSLATFQFISSVKVTNETFINIGAFSQLKADELQMKIKNINSIADKTIFLYTNQELDIDIPLYLQQLLSNALFVVQYSQQFVLGGKCLFDNIWLIDRLKALTYSNPQGLILLKESFQGDLTIGDPIEPIIIQNCNGFFQDKTIDSIQSQYFISTEIQYEKYTLYGAGSVMFNVHNSSNKYDSITVQNINIRDSYFTANKVSRYQDSNQVRIPAIISTYLGDEGFSNIPQIVQITGISLTNVAFDGASQFFEILGQNVTITDFAITKIGQQKYPGAHPFLIEYVQSDRVKREAVVSSAFCKVHFFSSLTLTQENVLISNMRFTEINPLSGALPLFLFTRSYNKLSQISNTFSMYDVTFKDSFLSEEEISTMIENTDEEYLLPKSSLIKVETPNEAIISGYIERLEMNKVYSRNGLFEIIGRIDELSIFNSTFTDIRGEKACVIFTQANTLSTLIIQSSHFIGNQRGINSDQLLLDIYFSKNYGLFKGCSLLKINQVPNVLISDSVFESHSFSKEGAFLDLSQNSSTIIENCNFQDLSASSAGAFVINLFSTALIKSSTFTNIMAMNQGVFQVSVHSSISILNSKFKGSRAIQNGVFKISSDSDFSYFGTDFIENVAYFKNSIGQAIQLGSASSINNCLFENNQVFSNKEKSQGKLIEFITNDVRIDINETSFKKNLALYGTSNLYISDSSDVNIARSSFNGADFNLNKTSSQIQGDFIQISSTSKVSITSCTFTGGTAQIGGAIHILGIAIVIIKNCFFVKNLAFKHGGAIFADSFISIEISQGSIFSDNKGLTNGGDSLYFQNSITGEAFISDTSFISNSQESNFVYTSDIQGLSLSLVNAYVINATGSQAHLKHSGFYIKDLTNLSVNRSSFVGLIGSNQLGGGAMVVEYTGDVLTQTIEISDCHFQNSHSANKGGGLSLIDVRSANIKETTFINNSAELQGGGLLFQCNTSGLIKYECLLNIRDTTFKENRAGEEGGAIKWNYYEPNRENVSFAQNTALIYGDDMAGVASQIVVIDKDQVGDKVVVDGQHGGYEKSVSSGGSVDFYFALVDQRRTIVSTDNKSKLFIQIVKGMEDLEQFTTIVETDTQFIATKGIFKVQQLVFVATPNSTQTLNFVTDGVDLNLPSNKKGEQRHTYTIKLKVRGCIAGEEMLSNGKCRVCSAGTYLLTAPSETTQCIICQQERSACMGGNEIYPLQGFWRSSAITDNMMECLNAAACLGGSYPLKNLTGECSKGYQGILCSKCERGYTLNTVSRECKRCPSNVINALILCAFALLSLVIIVVLVWSNLKSSGEEKNYLPVYFRILVNHLQVVTLVASFDFNWPDEFKTLFKGFQPLAEAQSEIFSVDCLLYYYSNDPEMRPFYVKTIVLFALPPAIVVLSFAGWYIIEIKRSKQATEVNLEAFEELDNEMTKVKLEKSDRIIKDMSKSSMAIRDGNEFAGKVIMTVIVILFLIHPTLTREMFNLFNCKNIEGVERLYIDLEEICYQGYHKTSANWFGIPSLILYGGGIPFIGFLAIFRNRFNLERQAIKQKYGFLYNGYKTGNASYWEIFIIYRKVIIIFIQVYFVQNGKLVQALMTLLFLGALMALVKYLQPYNKYCLNQLEFLSLVTSMASVYFCIYFISNKIDSSQLKYGRDTANLLMFLLITILQVGFFVYWLFQFLQEFKLTLISQYPRVYSLLCSCFNKKSLSIEIEEYKMKVISPFIEKIQSTENQLRACRSIYERGMVPVYDRDLRNNIKKLSEFQTKIQVLEKFHSKSALNAQIEEVISSQKVLVERGRKLTQVTKEKKKQVDRKVRPTLESGEADSHSMFGDQSVISPVKAIDISPKKPKMNKKRATVKLQQLDNTVEISINQQPVDQTEFPDSLNFTRQVEDNNIEEIKENDVIVLQASRRIKLKKNSQNRFNQETRDDMIGNETNETNTLRQNRKGVKRLMVKNFASGMDHLVIPHIYNLLNNSQNFIY